MEESYGEGVAIHTGPELCAVSREADGEALAGVPAGRALSPEIAVVWGADAFSRRGRPHPDHRQGEVIGDPTGSQHLSMQGTTTRANREIPGFLQAAPPMQGRWSAAGSSRTLRR
jgi:RNA-directed DNA polymerase